MSFMEEYARAAGLMNVPDVRTPPMAVRQAAASEPKPPATHQCGMCGDRQALVFNHECPGPYPVHMDEPCIGPFFDSCAPASKGPTGTPLVEYCCICLRPCQPVDPDKVERWLVGSLNVAKHPNGDLLNWVHIDE